MSAGDLILYCIQALVFILLFPIVICWGLFGFARIKGWDDPNITPMQIIERLSKK